jgi:hypothetical protein
MDYLIKEIGGSVTLRKTNITKDGYIRKERYSWKVSRKLNCLPILDKLIPYLVLKKERAIFLRDYILIFQFNFSRNGLTRSIKIAREKCYQEMLKLNNGVSKSSLIVLKPLPGNAEGNKVQAAKAGSMNAVSEKTSQDDAVL